MRAAVLALILGVAAAMLLYRDRPSEPQPVAPQTAAPAARPALTAAASPVPPQAEPEPPVSKTSAGSPAASMTASAAQHSSPAAGARPVETALPPAAGEDSTARIPVPVFSKKKAGTQEPPRASPTTPEGGRAELLGRYNEGILAQERGDWGSAERAFREVIVKDPAVIEAWNGLGVSLLRLGRLSDAEAALSRAHSLDPGYPPAIVNEGLLRLQEGRTGEAAELFRRAASLDPANPVPQVNLAIALGLLGKARESEGMLLAARRRFPSNPDLLYNLGALYERTSDRERGAEAYSAFLAVSKGRFPAREADVRERLRSWGALP